MPDAVGVIKGRVEHYKDLLKRKEELNKEFLNWKELYSEMEKVLDTVRKVYEKDRTEEAKKELDSWLKEEKDYLEMIHEHEKMLEEVNEELNEYDSKTYDEQADYLANLTRFQEISNKIKEIQKRSLRLAGNATIGTNIVVLENAEGRKKRINESFAPEYTRLVEEKRALAKIIRKQRDRLINKVDVIEPKVEDNNNSYVVETPSKIDNPNIDVVIYKNLLEDPKFEELSYEEKIEKLEAEMERMKNLPGRKQRTKYRGDIIELPRHSVGKYLLYAREVTKLKAKIEERDLFSKTPDNNIVPTKKSSVRKFILLTPEYASMSLEDKIRVLEEEIAKINSLSEDRISVNENGELVEYPINEFGYYKLYSDELSKLKKEKLKADAEFDKQNEELFAMVNAHSKKASEDDKKNKGFLKIINKKKPKNKESLKEKIKKAVVVIAAVVITVVAVSPVVTLVKDLFNKGKNKYNEPQTNNTSMVSSSIDTDKKEDDNNINYKTETEEEKSPVVNYKEQYFNHQFVISKDAPIYNNQYDAYLNRNQLIPDFSAETMRKVSGISIRVGDELKFYYENDSDEKIKELNDYLSNGAVVVSVYGTTEYGVDGHFNIQDVHIDRGLGGNSR